MARPAASVVLARADGRVLWVRRGDQLRFSAGFYAFPGGGVDVEDAAVPLLGAGGLDADEAACVAAAARELFEETGVLAVPGAARISRQERKGVGAAPLRRTAGASFGGGLTPHRPPTVPPQHAPARP